MINKALEDNWDKIKDDLPSVWEDLTISELELIQHSLQKAVTFIQEKYGMRELEYILQQVENSDSLGF